MFGMSPPLPRLHTVWRLLSNPVMHFLSLPKYSGVSFFCISLMFCDSDLNFYKIVLLCGTALTFVNIPFSLWDKKRWYLFSFDVIVFIDVISTHPTEFMVFHFCILYV